jgi:hypothetical protein
MSRVAVTAVLCVGLAAAGCDDSVQRAAPPTTPSVPIPTTPVAPFQTSSPITISPYSVRLPSSGVTLTITGSNFANGGRQLTNWTTWVQSGSEKSQVLSTHFVDSSHITADIPPDLLREPVTAWIYVTTACEQCDNHPNKGPALFVAVQ